MIEIGALTAEDYDALAQAAIDAAAEASDRGHYLNAARYAEEAFVLWKRADARRGGIREVGAC